MNSQIWVRGGGINSMCISISIVINKEVGGCVYIIVVLTMS